VPVPVVVPAPVPVVVPAPAPVIADHVVYDGVERFHWEAADGDMGQLLVMDDRLPLTALFGYVLSLLPHNDAWYNLEQPLSALFAYAQSLLPPGSSVPATAFAGHTSEGVDLENQYFELMDLDMTPTDAEALLQSFQPTHPVQPPPVVLPPVAPPPVAPPHPVAQAAADHPMAQPVVGNIMLPLAANANGAVPQEYGVGHCISAG
jgi:hypothetical protein